MGKICDTFTGQNYTNEDEVAHKFIVPFLKEFLGYRPKNLLFKNRYKQRDNFRFKEVNLNRSQKIKLENLEAEPDIIVANDIDYRKIFYKKYKDKNYNDKALFIVEAKGPSEKLEKYLEQKNAYCLAVHTNVCVMTNGTQFYIFDFNELILACENLEELDLNFPLIKILLHKDHQFESLVFKISQYVNKVKLPKPKNTNYSDFWEYIVKYLTPEKKEFETLGKIIKKIQNYNLFKFTLGNDQSIEYKKLLEEIKKMGFIFKRSEQNDLDDDIREESKQKNIFSMNRIVIQGESGVGKTYFLRHIKYTLINQLYVNEYEKIPVLLRLINWETQQELLKFILNEINLEIIKELDIRKYLRNGKMLLLLDGYDEIPQHLKNRFLIELSNFRKLFPTIPIIITVRKSMFTQDLIDKKEDNQNLITFNPPEIDDLKRYIQINLKSDPEQFLNQLREKNLLEFARIPLFLNYLIIYFKRYSSFPNSLYEILENLIKSYFDDHIRKKYIRIEPELLSIPQLVLSKLAFIMVYEKKKISVNTQDLRKILSSVIIPLREEYELEESFSDKLILDFFMKLNFITFENNQYSFWHPLLMNFFGAIELSQQINNNKLQYIPKELFHNSNMKEMIILSLPLINNERYITELRKNNVFLYIEALLQKPEISKENLDEIEKILLEKLNSRYRYIQEIVCRLFEKFFKYSRSPEKILIDIINQRNEPELVIWVLLELGKFKSQTAYNFLLGLNNFNLRKDRDLIGNPINGHRLVALSNFATIEVQGYIINEIEREWSGIPYLKMIGTAIFNIAHRKELSLNSFRKIMRIYNEPADFDIQLSRNSIKIDIRDSLEEVIIEYNNPHVTLLLFDILKRERHTFQDFNTIMILSKIIRNADLPLLIAQIKNDNISIDLRRDLAYILLNSELMIYFEELFDILEYIKTKDFIPNSSDLNEFIKDYNNYIRKHPDYVYSGLFGIISKCFLKEGRIKNFNKSKLLEFLKPYLEYQNSYVQEIIIEIFGKYNPEILLEKISFFFRRSLLKYLEYILPLDKDKAINMIRKYSKRFFTEPDDFHDYLMFTNMISLLLEYDFIEVSEDLFDRYIETNIDYENINLSSFRFISNFSKDYAIKILNHFKEKFYQLSDDRKFSRLRQLIVFVPPIEDDRYIEFCLENSKNFPREFDFSFSRIFNNLISLNPLKFEIEIIDLFQTKIRDGYRIYGALNILAFIGTNKSINFLSQFLEDTDNILRQKSFYCIRKIKERENIDWYNGEEIFC